MEQIQSLGSSLEVKCSSDSDNKIKKFKPKKSPRYLPGSEQAPFINRDLKEYNDHLYKVFTATSKIDTKPPAFKPHKYLKVSQLTSALFALAEIERQNKLLVQKINAINRSQGMVNSFNPYANNNCSKWQLKKKEFKYIDKENIKLYEKIVKAKSDYSKEEHDKFWKHVYSKFAYYAKFPLCLFDSLSTDAKLKQCPSITNVEILELPTQFEKDQRPKVYLDFKINNHINTIGKVYFELYNDVCPMAVENFVSLCSGNNLERLSYKNCFLQKVYFNQYCLLGDLTNKKGKQAMSLFGEYFEAENFYLEHNRPGVLSMVCNDDNKVNTQFCITFSRMPEFNNKKVVIGKCIKGAEFLKKISDYGNTIGKPSMPIVVCDCGVLEKKKKKRKIKKRRPTKNYVKMNVEAVHTGQTSAR